MSNNNYLPELMERLDELEEKVGNIDKKIDQQLERAVHNLQTDLKYDMQNKIWAKLDKIVSDSSLFKFARAILVGYLALGMAIWAGGAIFGSVQVKSVQEQSRELSQQIKEVQDEVDEAKRNVEDVEKLFLKSFAERTTDLDKTIDMIETDLLKRYGEIPELNKVQTDIDNLSATLKDLNLERLVAIENILVLVALVFSILAIAISIRAMILAKRWR